MGDCRPKRLVVDLNGWCFDFDRFRLYSRDQSWSVSDNAQAYVQGASWAHEYRLEDVQYLLRHSFYFYFCFEHLNFTWSYLIDMKISWSLDHIDLILTILGDLIWSLDLIIWWWSKICFFISTLHYYLHAFDMPLTHVFHWRLTCILHMLLRNMLLPYAWHALNICFTCVCLEDNTWTLVYNRS